MSLLERRESREERSEWILESTRRTRCRRGSSSEEVLEMCAATASWTSFASSITLATDSSIDDSSIATTSAHAHAHAHAPTLTDTDTDSHTHATQQTTSHQSNLTFFPFLLFLTNNPHHFNRLKPNYISKCFNSSNVPYSNFS